ncbi:MAG: hypothetical protein ACK5VW_01460 [Holosporales bacterium]
MIFIIALCALTYHVKQQVMDLDRELASYEREIFTLEESMHLLQAEWSYLTEPSRLQTLVQNYEMAAPLSGAQLVSLEQLPTRHQAGEMTHLVSAQQTHGSVKLLNLNGKE